MDFDKLKKDLEEKGIEKAQEELDKLKGRMGNFNSGNVSTASTNAEQHGDAEAVTGQNAGQIATSGRENTAPVMESGKAPVHEPEKPRREEQIREPGIEQDEQDAVSTQGQESAREAAIEENPASDEAEDSEEAA